MHPQHLEQRLRAELRRKAADAALSAEARPRLERRLRRQAWRRGGLAGLSLAALVILAGLALPALRGLQRGTTLGSVPGNSWRVLAPAPLSPRSVAPAVWTGTRMLVWGGAGSQRVGNGIRLKGLADGAAYAPRLDRWTRIAPAPLPGMIAPVAVWTGTRMLVWGAADMTATTAGAAYDPVTDTWQPIEPAPLPARSAATGVWTGGELLVWGGWAHRTDTSPGGDVVDGAAYDPATDTWRRLPDAPLPAGGAQTAAWTGSALVAFTFSGDRDPVCVGAAYTPVTNSWRRLAACPFDRLLNAAGARAVWTGNEVLLVQHPDDVLTPQTQRAWRRPVYAAYNPSTGTWRRPAAKPAGVNAGMQFVWTGRELLLVNADNSENAALARKGAAYDPSRDRWRSLPDAPFALASSATVWTGSDAVFWGGVATAGRSPSPSSLDNTGMAYRPGR
jgi:N-acetylneuraminic acid mutarotase